MPTRCPRRSEKSSHQEVKLDDDPSLGSWAVGAVVPRSVTMRTSLTLPTSVWFINVVANSFLMRLFSSPLGYFKNSRAGWLFDLFGGMSNRYNPRLRKESWGFFVGIPLDLVFSIEHKFKLYQSVDWWFSLFLTETQLIPSPVWNSGGMLNTNRLVNEPLVEFHLQNPCNVLALHCLGSSGSNWFGQIQFRIRPWRWPHEMLIRLRSGLSTGPEQHTFHPDADGSNFKARWNNGGRERFSTLSKDGGRCCASGVRDQDDPGKNQRTSASSTKYSRKEQPQDDVPKTLRQFGHHRSSAGGRGAKIQRGGAAPQRWGHGHCRRPTWPGATTRNLCSVHMPDMNRWRHLCRMTRCSRWERSTRTCCVYSASTQILHQPLKNKLRPLIPWSPTWLEPPPMWRVAERRSSTPTGTTWQPSWSGGYGWPLAAFSDWWSLAASWAREGYPRKV